MNTDIDSICNNVPGAFQVIKQIHNKKMLTPNLIQLMKNNKELQGSNLWLLYKNCNKNIHSLIIILHMKLLYIE